MGQSYNFIIGGYVTGYTYFGIYLGAGIQMPIGKHYARVHADWYKSLEQSSTGNMIKWGITAEFAL
jgi:hypothetical protein